MENVWGSKFAFACYHGDLYNVMRLFFSGANVNHMYLGFEHLGFPLHISVAHNRLDVVKFLLKCNGINVTQRTMYGDSVLVTAITAGVEMIELLLNDPRVDINEIYTRNGKTALLAAALNNKWDIVRALVSKGANVTTVLKHIRNTNYNSELSVHEAHLYDGTVLMLQDWKQWLPEWSPKSHRYFPVEFKEQVVAWLLVVQTQRRIKKCVNKDMRRYMCKFLAAGFKGK